MSITIKKLGTSNIKCSEHDKVIENGKAHTIKCQRPALYRVQVYSVIFYACKKHIRAYEYYTKLFSQAPGPK